MKCCLMQHFIWVFTVCQSTCLPVTRMKRVVLDIVYISKMFQLSSMCWHFQQFSVIQLSLCCSTLSPHSTISCFTRRVPKWRFVSPEVFRRWWRSYRETTWNSSLSPQTVFRFSHTATRKARYHFSFRLVISYDTILTGNVLCITRLCKHNFELLEEIYI